MFRDNKREIFGFRKYKAYGLASAVIAAFFLMGGVASADEVTSATSDTAAHVVTSPTETSADRATVASGEEVSANNATVENTVANTATTNTVTETLAATVEANTATETPAVASGDRASANTETASTTSTYVSEQAKQSVQDNLVPLAESKTSAPTAEHVYKEAPDAVSKLTSDDRVVEKENKEAFDKLPDAVRRRVKSVTIEKKENGNLGHTASISGNVTLNAQYFHNDGKDGETEVLYHEIGHAIDGATYKRNQDGSDYSLSRDAAVQPLIQKAYPGQVNYEGWASMFGTYMLQKTGQREIKTELDREINNYFANLMVGFTESVTLLHGDFVVSGTGQSEKHLTKSDQVTGAYNLEGTYTFSASGTDIVTGAKLVYEASKQFLEKPEFDVSVLSTGVTDKSDTNTWRYEFSLSPIGGTTVGQMIVRQRSKGMIWSGPTSTEPLKGTFKIVQDGVISDSDSISVTTDRVKSGLYRSDVSPAPTGIRTIAKVPTEAMIGVYSDGVFSKDSSAGLSVTLPVPANTMYLRNRDDANVQRDYERYSDFKYIVSGIPDYLELDPTVGSNSVWSREGDKLVMHLTPTSPFTDEYYSDYKPRLRLKTSALTEDDRKTLIANEKRVYLTWRTEGVLANGSTYVQELPDPDGILLKTRNDKEPLPEGSVMLNYVRTRYADSLREKSDHSHESFRIESSMDNRDQSGKQSSSNYYYVHIPKDQTGDRFTYFMPANRRFGANVNGKDVRADDVGLNLTSAFEVYGVEADGSTTKLGSWDRIDSKTKGIEISGNYQKLLIKTPIMKDVKSTGAKLDIFSWGATVTYAVDDARWKAAAQDPTVTEMRNGLRTDFVRTGNSLEAGAQVEHKSLTQEQMNELIRVYVHDKNTFKHELSAAISVNNPKGDTATNAVVGLDDTVYLGFCGELGQYYQYLRGGSTATVDRLDGIEKAYTSVLVPDGVSIANARLSLTNKLLSGSTSAFSQLSDTSFLGNAQQPVSKIVNYKNTGKTLYVYEAPRDAEILNAIDRLKLTSYDGTDRPSVEMTFEFTNNGSIPVGSHEIEYATIWDKRSELIDPVESQTLRANAQTLDDVLPSNLQDGFSDKKVSVIKVPFVASYKNEYASRLYIGEDETSATKSAIDGVHLGKTVTVQSRSMNFSSKNNTLTDVVVSVPNGVFKTELVEKIPDGANYKVLYTTDSDVKNGTYGEAPADLSQVTAVRYKFTSPFTLHTGDAFVTNMKVRIPGNAPTSTPATSQLFTSSDGVSFLDGNKVTVTTTNNLGYVKAYFVDTEGHTLKDTVNFFGLDNMPYTTTKPARIERDDYIYVFKEVKEGSDPEQGRYVADETKQVTYVYEKDTRNPKSSMTKITIKHVLDPNDEMTNRFRNMQLTMGDLQHYDLQQTGELTQPVVKTINAGSTGSISKLSSKSIYEPYDISTFGDGMKFDYTRVTAEMTDDLKEQLNSETISVDNDTSIQGTGVKGSEATITYYYKVRTGKLVERFVDKAGVEISPAKESAESIAYGEFVSTGHPDSIQSGNSTYNYESTDAPAVYRSRLVNGGFGVVEGTTTVTYVYDKVVNNGSVIATYKDTEGNELAPQENVKTDVPDGEAYTTVAKTIPSSEVVEKTPEGLTKRTTTSYELTETPSNATGNVVGGSVTTVPYVYRKNVTVQTYGSVIATYKDEEGNELASTEKVITNQPGGTYYEAAPKDIQGSAQSKVTPEGRTVTITTYKLIKTPDNETGEVRDGEIIEVPYVYRKNVEERMVPGNTPSVEIPELKVTQYQTEDGTDIKTSEQGFVDAPNTIDKYQFTGTTNTNEGGDVQTHIYKLIETDKPNDAPQVDVPVLNVTRYVNEEGTEIKDAEEGLVPAPSMIGEHYQFTGRTETTEDGTVQTHIYKVVEHEVPGDAPKREPEEIQITLHVDEETGKELVEYDPGLTSPKEIEHYTYTGKTTQEEGIRTHYYKKVITEVPGDAPSVEIPELKVTRYQTEDGTDIKESETGFVDAPKTIDNYQFTGVTNMNEGNDVQTHIYAKIVTEVPGDAPQVDIPELQLTRHVSEKGKELLPIEEGSNGPRKTIGDYEYTGRTDVEGGITTHVYAPIRYELPGDAPQYDIPELKVTRHVDEKGKELIETEKGNQPPRKTIRENEYTGRTTEKDGITTHVYTPIKHEIPGDAPQYDIPELKVTRHVDEKGKELIETEKGNQPPRKTIGDHEYTGRTTEKNGITTHVYESIKHEIPGDAPIVDVPELKVTRYVNEKGEEIKESEAGFIDAPKTIGEYEFTGKTELNDGKDVQTHIYKLVEKPVTPTPDPKKPETPSPRTPDPKKPETPQPEAPKPIETPKSNDSVVESVDQPQFVKNELPKTGETNSNLALVGVSLLTALGLIGFVKRKREE